MDVVKEYGGARAVPWDMGEYTPGDLYLYLDVYYWEGVESAVECMLAGEYPDEEDRLSARYSERKETLLDLVKRAMYVDNTGVYFLGWYDHTARTASTARFPPEAYYWWWRAGGAWLDGEGGNVRNYVNPAVFESARYTPESLDDSEILPIHYPAGMDALKGYLESSEPLAHVDNPTPPPGHTPTFKPSDDLGREIVEALKASGISEDFARGIAKKLPKWLAKDDRLTPQKSPYRPFLLALVLASYLLEEGYRVERNTRDDVPSSHEGDMSIEVQRKNTVDVLTLKPGRPPQGDIERSNYFPKPPQRPDGDNFLEYVLRMASAQSILKKRDEGQPWEQYGSVSDSDRDALRRALSRYRNPSKQ